MGAVVFGLSSPRKYPGLAIISVLITVLGEIVSG